jgi:NitT/TauT family transport system permease protein
MIGRLKNIYKVIVIMVFFGIWEFMSRTEIFNPVLVPAFTDVAKNIWNMFTAGDFTKHLIISLKRAGIGFALAVIAGIPLGFLLGGWFKTVKKSLEWLMEIFSQVNPFVMFYIIILILGIGEEPKVIIIMWACLWPVITNTIAGIQNVNQTLLKAARGFGLGRAAIFVKVVFPASLPSIFTGLRLSAGYSVFMLVAAEMMGASSGLGWLIKSSEENYQILNIYGGALVIALLGVFIDCLMQFLEKRFTGRIKADCLNSEI